jgi:predicted nucleic acid-binding protein
VVIYLDSSVFLAWLFGEERRPSPDFWSGRFVSSRLLAYETWTWANARAYPSHVKAGMEQALAVVDLIDMTPEVLARALQPFPIPVRTLDALHLATMVHLAPRSTDLRLATYDRRMAEAAQALGFPLADLT